MSKILYSPGYGAGWSSWNSGETGRFMLTYAPIVDFIEAGGEFTSTDHPLLVALAAECLARFGTDYVCLLGATDLRVWSGEGRVRVEEYDGSESVVTEGEQDWY